jgi:hypothetical protein
MWARGLKRTIHAVIRAYGRDRTATKTEQNVNGLSQYRGNNRPGKDLFKKEKIKRRKPMKKDIEGYVSDRIRVVTSFWQKEGKYEYLGFQTAFLRKPEKGWTKKIRITIQEVK